MILDQQMKELVEDVKGDMTNGQAGTGTSLFDKTDTGLGTAVGATDVALNDVTNTSVSISVTHVLTVSLGNGSTLTEFEINNGATSYNRTVKAGFAKTASDEYNVFHTFTFEVIV